MNILIVSATREELAFFTQHFGNHRKIGNNLFSFTLRNSEIFILITGITYVSLIYYLTQTIKNFRFDLVINAGIAGSYKKSIPIGETVNVRSELFSDFLIEDKDDLHTLFTNHLINKNEFPFKDGRLLNNTTTNSKTINDLKTVNSLTSNTIHGSFSTINAIKDLFDPDIESMEGAGFFYVCLMEKIPFFEIRSVSNIVEPMNKKNWQVEFAIKVLNDKLIEILDNANF